MKFSDEKPQVYDRCHELFGVKWDEGIIFTYGDTIHCKFPVSPELLAHEAIHIEQQTTMGKELWWDKYFEDKAFRLSQEVEAYRVQMWFIDENYARPLRRKKYRKIFKDMARMYGNMCTEDEAKELLKYENPL